MMRLERLHTLPSCFLYIFAVEDFISTIGTTVFKLFCQTFISFYVNTSGRCKQWKGTPIGNRTPYFLSASLLMILGLVLYVLNFIQDLFAASYSSTPALSVSSCQTPPSPGMGVNMQYYPNAMVCVYWK